MAGEKMRLKSRVHSPEIIQISLLGRLQETLEHNDCFYAASVLEQRIKKPPTHNVPTPQNYFQTNCRNVISILLKSIGTTLERFV